MSLSIRLALALPPKDINGDTFELIPRARVFDKLHGLINPIKHRFVSVEHDPTYPRDKWLTNSEEVQAGRARLIADLNTDEGRAAFLDCWWPLDVDGCCLAVWAQHGCEEGVPYPTCTLMRRASMRHLLAPDTLFDVMRFGSSAFTATTTTMRAHWDIGIRRVLMHPTQSYDAWLKQQLGAPSPRMIPLDPDDPLRTYEFAPGHREKKDFAYFIDMTDRPKTDYLMDWLKGTP